MTVDPSRHRLFVAELENDAIAVVDLQLRKLTHAIMDVSQPQGLAYVALMDTLFAANGGDGSLRLFQGDGYHLVSKISLGEDADNIRVDVGTSVRSLNRYGMWLRYC